MTITLHTQQVPEVPTREQAETLPQYAARVLGYALAHGLTDLSTEQIEQADQAAQRAAAALPMKLSPSDSRLDDALHVIRHRIARTLQERRSARAQLARMLRDLYPPTEETEPQAAAQGAPEDDATRAARLMRAALTLIMDPRQGEGGKGARLVRPTPSLPPSGIAQQPPTGQRGRF